MTGSTNGWGEHKRLVEHRLGDLEVDMEEQKKRTNQHEVDLALLNLKASAWGAAMGTAATILVQLAIYLLSLITKS
jgi:hypothetical protein